jgi:hypothetical protein
MNLGLIFFQVEKKIHISNKLQDFYYIYFLFFSPIESLGVYIISNSYRSVLFNIIFKIKVLSKY